MIRRHYRAAASLLLALCAAALPFVFWTRGSADALPVQLTDQEFWRVVSDFSEPDGYFRSDNLLSNEIGFPEVIPALVSTAVPGRVYLGVGPEQNFTYITALEPGMAFIVDIRRGNLLLHLVYKALFELSADRAEFVSRLFSRERPEGLGPESTPVEIFSAYEAAAADEELYRENLQAILAHLTVAHAFGLSLQDREQIDEIYSAFFEFGPTIRYSSSQRAFAGFNQPSYAELMEAVDVSGRARSYLASEESFRFLKDLESTNRVVPVVGNFGGPKAIRAIGRYLRARGATVSAFYLSNVEQYLEPQNLADEFCGNVSTLPLDESSTFIRSIRGGRYGSRRARQPGDLLGGRGPGLGLDLGDMTAEVEACH